MDHWVQRTFWIVFLVLLIVIGIELLPRGFNFGFTEGFSGPVSMGNSRFWAKLVPRRGDVGPEREQDGFLRDDRYFSGYVDVQRLGVQTDFCRMVQRVGNPKDKFIACALGGTENLSAIAYHGPSVEDGFSLSRDDYMRDIDGDGQFDYCRILKTGNGEFQSMCIHAQKSGFSEKDIPDSNPPKDIAELLEMYQGCVFWLRFRDDMLDYIQNLYVSKVGEPAVEEKPPRPPKTEGLVLDGKSQFLRIGDDPYLSFGATVQLRNLRSIMFWVKFDEFTNNAHVFDFGNGAGNDNVWVGILNRGNNALGQEDRSKSNARLLCGNAEFATVPTEPSGAQPVQETTPQDLMKTSSANVEEYTCEGFAVAPITRRKKCPIVQPIVMAETADMVYELWDRDQRKMRLVIPNMFEKNKWVHVTITTEGTDSFRPDIAIYKNGEKVYLEPSGWLPQSNQTEKNYIGKSNWSDVTSQYANKDELFKGSLFDFRGYNVPLSKKLICKSYAWGHKLLETRK